MFAIYVSDSSYVVWVAKVQVRIVEDCNVDAIRLCKCNYW